MVDLSQSSPIINPLWVAGTSKTTFYNDQPHYNINKKYNQEHLNNNQNLKHSEISEISVISEKIQKVAKLSEYVKMFDKSLKSTQLKQIK